GAVPAVARIVDGQRRPLAGLGARLVRAPAAGGIDLLLTIDRRLQAAVDRIADRSLPRGAIVVMSPWTGEILALASRPSFDPRRPAAELRTPGAPFLNRALTAYHPGSIFKLVVLAAALEKDPDVFMRLFEDPGRLACGHLTFHCPGGGHGLMTLADALAFSCNTVFIRLALELGLTELVRTAERLGLGVPACLDLPGEALGCLPPAEDGSPGSLANTALGQGAVTVTPLQVARMIGAVANGGRLVGGRILLGTADGKGRVRALAGGGAPVRVISARTARLMRIMMAGVIRYGTGRAAAVSMGAAGKTGTAQSGTEDPDGRRVNHAWFAGFAPLSRPRYVVVVLAEGGGAGGAVAAPVFRQVMETALGRTGTKEAKGT
ncbi:MAG: peptidoglycan D,D-transpeptidase FtsI family protein, partial [Bacteroidota bacterium]